ncbi:YaiO family outer membrane beta-barrel protein, partial [Escherichia coli]|uniref:YaiO family outer membrane beta-barrel protein n=1 Tax=Escherichia coli TaxID=562 RepID=UPI00203C02F4
IGPDPRNFNQRVSLGRNDLLIRTFPYTYDWTPETRYGSMKSVSLQRIQPLTEQLNLGLTAGKVWYDTPTDDYNGLQLAAHLTWKF